MLTPVTGFGTVLVVVLPHCCYCQVKHLLVLITVPIMYNDFSLVEGVTRFLPTRLEIEGWAVN